MEWNNGVEEDLKKKIEGKSQYRELAVFTKDGFLYFQQAIYILYSVYCNSYSSCLSQVEELVVNETGQEKGIKERNFYADFQNDNLSKGLRVNAPKRRRKLTVVFWIKVTKQVPCGYEVCNACGR